VEYTEEDPKPQIEEECKAHCVKEWQAYKACAERIKSDTTGQAHCSGQYFDFWHCVDHCHSSSGRHLVSPMRCVLSAALHSLSSHLPGCGAGLALAALPLPLPAPLVGWVGSAACLLRLAGGGVLGPGSEAAGCVAAWLLRGACGGLRGATTGHHIRPRTGWPRSWLQAGRTRRGSTCPAGGFQPAGLVALSLSSSSSQGCWPFTAELTRLVRCSSARTTLPRRWPAPLGLHTTLRQARNTASAPQPPAVPMLAAPKNTTSCLACPCRFMDNSAMSSSNCSHAHKAHTCQLITVMVAIVSLPQHCPFVARPTTHASRCQPVRCATKPEVPAAFARTVSDQPRTSSEGPQGQPSQGAALPVVDEARRADVLKGCRTVLKELQGLDFPQAEVQAYRPPLPDPPVASVAPDPPVASVRLYFQAANKLPKGFGGQTADMARARTALDLLLKVDEEGDPLPARRFPDLPGLLLTQAVLSDLWRWVSLWQLQPRVSSQEGSRVRGDSLGLQPGCGGRWRRKGGGMDYTESEQRPHQAALEDIQEFKPEDMDRIQSSLLDNLPISDKDKAAMSGTMQQLSTTDPAIMWHSTAPDLIQAAVSQGNVHGPAHGADSQLPSTARDRVQAAVGAFNGAVWGSLVASLAFLAYFNFFRGG
ncbi:hypothetical protein QJQ45_022634, partial [Haematococcus lacustris]